MLEKKFSALLGVLGLILPAQAQVDLTLDPSNGTEPVFEPGGGTSISAPQQVDVFVSTQGLPGLDYNALVLDRGATNNLFIKVQSQDGLPDYDTCGFFQGNNAGGWPGMTGGPAFFQIPFFDLAVITCLHDGLGNVTLNTPSGTFTRGGWTPQGGNVRAGLGFFRSLFSSDDFQIQGVLCDSFNRPNGPIGPDWTILAGNLQIVNNAATGNGYGVFNRNCGGGGQCTGNEAISVKPKGNDNEDRAQVKLTKAVPGARVEFSASVPGAVPIVKTVSNSGSAKVTFSGEFDVGPYHFQVIIDCNGNGIFGDPGDIIIGSEERFSYCIYKVTENPLKCEGTLKFCPFNVGDEARLGMCKKKDECKTDTLDRLYKCLGGATGECCGVVWKLAECAAKSRPKIPPSDKECE